MAKAKAKDDELPWREIQTSGWPVGPMRFTRAQVRADVKAVIAERLAREAAEKEARRQVRKTAKALETASKSRNGGK